jgi:hypothetical protein
MKKYFPQLLLALVIALTSFLPGCIGRPAVLIDAAYDIQSPMERKVIPDYISSNLSFSETKIQYSSNPIQSLKDGDCDFVILGSDPQPGTLDGLNSTVIAYDAVCVLVDYNSWLGGEYWTYRPYINAIQPAAEVLPIWGWNPVCKMVGLQNLTIDDLKGIYSSNVNGTAEKWTYNQFYSWDSLVDFNTGEKSFFKQWLNEPKQITPAIQFKPGNFDTQTLLYNILGLQQPKSTTTFKSEESALSTLYNSAAGQIGQQPFNPIISIASRMVTQIALQHVGAAVVSINGINPVTDIDAIYNGTYPLSRKIYLISRKNLSPDAQKFENYLLSADGQNALANAGLLPLQEPTNASVNQTLMEQNK